MNEEGEWKLNTQPQLDIGGGFLTTQMSGDKFAPVSEREANANLIAAAPDMYAMIKELAHELNLAIDECNEYRAKVITQTTLVEPDYIDKQTVYEAQVLLAKARGEK
jgi:hypothetical protein